MADEDAKRKFKRLLECSVCLEQLSNPKMLSCQHTFCQRCLEPLVKSNGSLMCPVCRAEMTLPGGQVQDLPSSMLASAILESLCKECKVNVKSESCAHCGDDLCAFCHTKHMELLKTNIAQFLNADIKFPTQEELNNKIEAHIETNMKTEQGRLTSILKNCSEILHLRGEHLKQELTSQITQDLQGELESQKLEHQCHCKCLDALRQEVRPSFEQGLDNKCLVQMSSNCDNFIKQGQFECHDYVKLIVDEDVLYSTLRQFGKIRLQDNTATSDMVTEEESASSVSGTATGPVIVDYSAKCVPKRVICTRGHELGQLYHPARVTVSPLTDEIIVADTGNNRIQIFDKNFKPVRAFGSEGTEAGEFQGPKGVAVTRDGNIAVADVHNNRIQLFTSTGEYMYMFGSAGTGPGEFGGPIHVATDKDGLLYVCDWDNHRVQVMTQAGAIVRIIGSYGSEPGQFNHPAIVTVNKDGDVVVSDTWNNRVQIFSSSGEHKHIVGQDGSLAGEFYSPLGLATDDACNLIVSDFGNNRVQIFDKDGIYLSSFGQPGIGEGHFNRPAGVAITKTGEIIVCDYANHRMQVF